ncbi:hypothetical protein EJB05_00732, partial [Eragrostis curvula]
MGRLETTAGNIDYTLNQHILQTHQWQERTDTQLTNLTNMTEQGQADLSAYFRHMGWNKGEIQVKSCPKATNQHFYKTTFAAGIQLQDKRPNLVKVQHN